MAKIPDSKLSWEKHPEGGWHARGRMHYQIVLRDGDPPYGLYTRAVGSSGFIHMASGDTVQAMKDRAQELDRS